MTKSCALLGVLKGARGCQAMFVPCWVGNIAAQEIDEAACAYDDVRAGWRRGGGGAVVLHPGCVVVSVGAWTREPFRNALYFMLINESVVDVLRGCWPGVWEFTQRGISDIAVGGAEPRKIAGTSMFRSGHYLLYQGSLLVDPRCDLLERYLNHPSREPDYRQGRSHEAFVTGLAAGLSGKLTAQDVAKALERDLPDFLIKVCGDGLLAPSGLYCPYLHDRMTIPFTVLSN